MILWKQSYKVKWIVCLKELVHPISTQTFDSLQLWSGVGWINWQESRDISDEGREKRTTTDHNMPSTGKQIT